MNHILAGIFAACNKWGLNSRPLIAEFNVRGLSDGDKKLVADFDSKALAQRGADDAERLNKAAEKRKRKGW